jgi:hypothetical protein
MIRSSLYAMGCLAPWLVVSSPTSFGYSDGITSYTPFEQPTITGFSGHPSEQTCSYCHFNGAGAADNGCTPAGSFTDAIGTISAQSQVVRGGTAPITFTVSNAGSPNEITLGGMGARIDTGSFTGDDSVRITNNGSFYSATHVFGSNTATAGTVSWTWDWVAPNTLGTYTLYVCGNPTNGTGGCDGDGPHTNTCKTHTFEVINRSPVAQNDNVNGSAFLTVSEDSLLATVTGDVRANDNDPDGDALSVTSFTQPSKGLVTDTGNGTFGFNPNGAFESLDSGGGFEEVSFTYQVSDGRGGGRAVTQRWSCA